MRERKVSAQKGVSGKKKGGSLAHKGEGPACKRGTKVEGTFGGRRGGKRGGVRRKGTAIDDIGGGKGRDPVSRM